MMCFRQALGPESLSSNQTLIKERPTTWLHKKPNPPQSEFTKRLHACFASIHHQVKQASGCGLNCFYRLSERSFFKNTAFGRGRPVSRRGGRGAAAPGGDPRERTRQPRGGGCLWRCGAEGGPAGRPARHNKLSAFFSNGTPPPHPRRARARTRRA